MDYYSQKDANHALESSQRIINWVKERIWLTFKSSSESQIPKYLNIIVSNLKEKYGSNLLFVFLFGSRATNSATTRSDIDILAVIDDLKKPEPLSPPLNIPLGVDIIAVPSKEFEGGIIAGKGFFIEIMVYGKSLYGEKSILTYYKELAQKTIKKYSMVRSNIGWKKERFVT